MGRLHNAAKQVAESLVARNSPEFPVPSEKMRLILQVLQRLGRNNHPPTLSHAATSLKISLRYSPAEEFEDLIGGGESVVRVLPGRLSQSPIVIIALHVLPRRNMAEREQQQVLNPLNYPNSDSIVIRIMQLISFRE